MLRQFVPFAALLLAAACASHSDVQVTKSRATAPSDAGEAAFASVSGASVLTQGSAQVAQGNADLAAIFLELSFAMESGRSLPQFSRFEGPVTVALTGDVPTSAAPDLAELLARLRTEAGIDVAPAATNGSAAITIEFLPKEKLRRLAPTASCFVVPNVASMAEYRGLRGTAAVDWAQVLRRDRAAIFIPSDTSPQEVRDCLHEEMAQALGPLNDLYRLPDSVFNDDNFHSTLTRFDMLMLRAYYAPDLRSGMGREQVSGLIGPVFARLNPGGEGYGRGDLSATPRAWISAIETALSPGGSQAARRAAANRALSLAQGQGWRDGRLAFSHFAVARLHVGSDRPRAIAEFAAAAAIYRGLPGGAIHIAHIDMQLAAIAVASGQPEQAIGFIDRSVPVVRAAENQALLASLLLLKAEALDMLGQADAARALRVDSRAAARYGFGSDAQIRAREHEISALGSRGSSRG